MISWKILLSILVITFVGWNLAEAQNEALNEVQPLFNYTDLGTWEPTAELYKDMPYYHAGYDYEGRPVLVTELGRWNVSKYYASGDNQQRDRCLKYMEQSWYRIYPENNFFPNISQGYFFIIDMERWNLQQFRYPGVIPFYLRAGSISGRVFDPNTSVTVLVNVNFAAQTLIDLIKPYVGEAFAAVETFGTNKERFIPRLLKGVPKDQLPPWYGGNKNYKPVRTFY